MDDSRPQEPPPTERHKRAVIAVRALFRLFPLEASRWLCSRRRDWAKGLEVLEASYLEQPRPGPAYVVPEPKKEPERPATVEGLMKTIVTEAIEREAAESGGEIEIVSVDMAELTRQTLVKGGCDVEVVLRGRGEDGKAFPWVLG